MSSLLSIQRLKSHNKVRRFERCAPQLAALWLEESLVKRFIALAASVFAVTPIVVASPDLGTVEFLVQQSVEGLKVQTAAHSAAWRLGEEASWSVDQDKGIVQFLFADGVVATAPVQIIGTYNPQSGTFLWGWDHPSVVEPLSRAATLVRRYGEEHNVVSFTTREVYCTEAEAWTFTAVAAALDSANGAYRANSGGPLVYMTFGDVQLEKQP